MFFSHLEWFLHTRVERLNVSFPRDYSDERRASRIDKAATLQARQRARIVLLSAQGMMSKGIAVQLGVGRVQVSRWRERYAESRLAGI